MAVCYDLFDCIRTFDNTRRGNRNEYINKMNGLIKYRNSEGFEKDKAAAAAKRKSSDDLARENAKKKINECLQKMKENAGKVELIAPTQEMVNILQVLNMKSRISKQELERAAVSMKGNSFGLSALNDIADKHFYVGSTEGQSHPNYLVYSTDLSGTATENYINSIAKLCNEILRSSAKKGAYEAARFNSDAHGIPFDEDSLPQRGELVSERQFFGEIIPERHYDFFMRAVNGQ